jgi:hypothetical protein
MAAKLVMKTMKTNSELEKVQKLEKKCEQMRKRIGVSVRGEVLYHAPQSMWSENDVAVEADGEGGAKLLIVCGNYPSDYSIKTERRFPTEDDACNAADEIVERARNVPAAAC